jgi:hypothetical protein
MTGAIMLNVFNLWNTSSDGFLKMSELKAVLLTLGVGLDRLEHVWSKADDKKNGFVDYSRFVIWVWSDEAPIQVKDEIQSWIMEGSGKTKSSLSDWTFHPWIVGRDRDVVTELTLKENGSFEQKTIRVRTVAPANEQVPPPLCTITGSGSWELDQGDCILQYVCGRVDGFTLSKLKQLHEANKL